MPLMAQAAVIANQTIAPSITAWPPLCPRA